MFSSGMPVASEILRRKMSVSLLFAAAVTGRAQDLRAGYAKADITPTGPVMMGGYDLRGTPSDGVYARSLIVPALVFDAAAIRAAFLDADVIVIHRTDAYAPHSASPVRVFSPLCYQPSHLGQHPPMNQ